MVGTKEVCTECKTAGNVPVNGACTKVGEATNDKCLKAGGSALESTATQCGQCGTGYFLHKGGCYSKDAAPGSTICTAQTTAGVCATCNAATGYFKNPEAAATTDSCISCGDAAGVTIPGSNGNTYKGVANCATCQPPEAANPSSSQQRVATCTACVDGYYGTAAGSGVTCTQCTDPCASCTASGTDKCTSCKDASPYFKKGTGETGECVAKDACTSTHFPTIDANQKKICTPCNDASNGGVADCQECSKTGDTLKCLTCNKDKKPNTAGTACVACSIANCANCNEENVCEACTSKKKLSPLKDACLTDCPAGTYDSSNVCTPCHTSCSSCSDAGESSCAACYPGHVLSKGDTTKGTCIPECTGRYAENCEANQCTAVLGGSKYCSRCKSGYVPVDGLCVSATARAPTGCTSKGDGTCSACTSTYFLQSGGCYQAAVYPGNTLCTAASQGKCTNCANGQDKDSNGSCPACPANCASCAKDSGKACTKCFPGYYLDSANACKKCSETSGTITGVDNCISCEKPSGDSGTVTCYVKTSGGGSGDNSTGSDPNLSAGAIAGISVAAVVVVAGLVGFLCWWFICRGKA